MPDLEGGGRDAQHDMRGVLPAGTVLHGYELRSILGQGAFGITYRARDTTLDRDVAIKEYLPTALALREGRTTVMPRSADHAEQFAWGRERFLDEARTLARLDRTPAIVRVHDFLEANGTAYMVMALIEGETMNKRLLREPQLAPEAVERALFPLLDGLEEVHAVGFLHRDIKPANIMLDASGRPTLIDFGASRAAMAERSITLTAVFTPRYAAAEQFTSIGLGPWTDIYGLAATLYHAITGQIPPSAVQRILNDTYQPLAELRPPGYEPALLTGIDAGLGTRVEDRPQSVAEWRAALRAEGAPSSQQPTFVSRQRREGPGRSTRAARRSRPPRAIIRSPVLLSSAAPAILALAAAGWFAWQANPPPAADAAALSLSTEQLELVLAERRKADALAADKRRLEEEARQRAETEAEAKRQAEAELEQTRQARQKAEEELTRLKADMETRRQAEAGQREQVEEAAARRAAEEEAQRKAETEAASLRQAEEEAAKKAAADAEAKRQADEALAQAETERRRAEEEAHAKAEAEQAAMRQASEEAQRKAAEAESKRQAEAQAKAQAEREKADAEAKAKAEGEAAEKGLRLENKDRERLQVALTSLGFDTRGSDGVFGPRSREMIVAWQKKAGAPTTGFLTAAQHQALLREAASALSKFDEQKKAEEQKKADEEAKARAPDVPVSAPVAASGASSSTASPGGLWRGTYACGPGAATSGWAFTLALEMQLSNGSGSTSFKPADSNGQTMSLRVFVRPAGVTVTRTVLAGGAREATLSGSFDGNSIRASGIESEAARRTCTLTLTRGGSPTAAASAPATSNVAAGAPPATPPSPGSAGPTTTTAYDGTYSSIVSLPSSGYGVRLIISLQLTNGRGSGAIGSPGCSSSRFSLTISSTGNASGEGYFNCAVSAGTTTMSAGPLKIDGSFVDRNLKLSFRTERNSFAALLNPRMATPPVLASPDGLWRGTYACSAVLGSFGSAPPFTLDLTMQLVNGSGSWNPSDARSRRAGSLEIRVSVDSTAASVTRFTAEGDAGKRSSLFGQYDGNTISASGRETTFGNRDCTLSLTRASPP